ncbi:MAG: uroporphyrinogen-III C-methyltransferase [Candidatus Omnitrophica bacterium]|nr:uroporphyrinogen-III C-methyltransferase [Candidatus Omnitrophota bacterium]
MIKPRCPGKVYLVGAGPGDAGLVTVKALDCLKKADVVLYDRLVAQEILKACGERTLLQYVGKEKGDSSDQGAINELILTHALLGKTVVRLKGGDPFIFGRGQEEMSFLMDRGIDCEVVPGVSSFYAAPEVCGIPLTYRGIASSFLVVTGHEDPAKGEETVDWQKIAKFSGTLVIMMGLSNLKEITRKLLRYGKNGKTLAAVVSNGTTKSQKMIMGDLSNIAKKASRLKAPAICVIGDVVKVAFQLNKDLRPLANKRFLTTASDNLNRDIIAGLKKFGASVHGLPMIKIVPNKDTSVLDDIIRNSKDFSWLVFTSRHGVQYFMERFGRLKGKAGALHGRIACVGTGTSAEFVRHGIKADLMPDVFTTKDLALALVAQGLKAKKVALLRTPLQEDHLKDILVKAGAVITDCIVYNVKELAPNGALTSAIRSKPDGIFFLSPRGVDVFFSRMSVPMRRQVRREAKFFSIGPVTTMALKKQGAEKIREPREYSVRGLVQLCLEESQ